MLTAYAPRRAKWSVRVVAFCSLLWLVTPGIPSVAAEEEDASSDEQPSITLELVKGLTLLEDELAKQHELLTIAQTDRERDLIRNHIRFLEREHESLNELLSLLVGPRFNAREWADEQRAERGAVRDEKTLEKDERFPSP